MRPGIFRNDWRFLGASTLVLSLATTVPAQATPINAAIVGNAPLAVALGAAAFALLASLAVRKLAKNASSFSASRPLVGSSRARTGAGDSTVRIGLAGDPRERGHADLIDCGA